MPAYVEVWKRSGPERVPLLGERITIGKSPTNDIAIADATVSRLHAVLERLRSGWCLRDLGSRNGTMVNGARVVGDRALRPGDEILVGKTRMVFHADRPTVSQTATEAAQPAPELTRRERDLLVELCRPVLTEHLFAEPASVRDMASRLVVTESAVKKHLVRLYDKFELWEESERHRGRLATEAIRRAAVTIADLGRRSKT